MRTDLVNAVIQDCSYYGIKVTTKLAALTVRYVKASSEGNEDDDDEDYEQELIRKSCQAIMEESDDLPFVIIRMQALFHSYPACRDDILSSYSQQLWLKHHPLFVKDTSRANYELQNLREEKLIPLLVALAPLNGAHEDLVKKTFNSIASMQDVIRFARLDNHDKRLKIKEWSQDINGLILEKRLRGHQDLSPNWPVIFGREVSKILNEMDFLQGMVGEKCEAITESLELQLFDNQANDHATSEWLKQTLACLWQFQIFLFRLRGEIKKTRKLFKARQKQFDSIRKATQSPPRQPTNAMDLVTPDIRSLSEVWKGFEDDVTVIDYLDELFQGLKDLVQAPLQKIKIKSKQSFTSDSIIVGLNLELNGFCPVALVSGKGLVIQGVQGRSLISLESKYFSCSSKERARLFRQDPGFFLAQIQNLVLDHPHLELLLGMNPDQPKDMASQTD